MLTVIRSVWKQCRRLSTDASSGNFLELLENRKLVRISGGEIGTFLQGLITNDIHHLDRGIGSMYTMLLNTKGRVLYDTIVYRTHEENTLLLECDSGAVEQLMKHLKMYRLRRKIDVTSVDDLDVYAIYNPSVITCKNKQDVLMKSLEGVIVPCDVLNETQPDEASKTYNNLIVYKDPRAGDLGSRVIAPRDSNVPEQICKVVSIAKQQCPNYSYRWFRYNLGLGEGISDLPPGNCFPLEANCDYLHGVSFHKGCYIGQELTARTYHTGVVRKRYMPLFFIEPPKELPVDGNIIHNGKRLGKLRGVIGNVGLGLLNVAAALEGREISVGDALATTEKPLWWPLEVPKEKASLPKTD